MGASAALFKTGANLLFVGLLIALVEPPLGVLLGRLGLGLIGGAFLLVLGHGLLSVVAITDSTKDVNDDPPAIGRGVRRRNTAAETGRSDTETGPHGPDAAGPEQRDLDVDSIDDYKR